MSSSGLIQLRGKRRGGIFNSKNIGSGGKGKRETFRVSASRSGFWLEGFEFKEKKEKRITGFSQKEKS